MAIITGRTDNGNCQPAEFNNDGIYDVWPQVEKSYIRSGETNLWYKFYAKIQGEIGETVAIRLNWPHYERYFINGGYGNGAKNNDPFSYMAAPYNTVIPDIVYTSHNECDWTIVERSHIKFDTTYESILIELVLEYEQIYLSVGFPYTKAMFYKLNADLTDSEYVKCSSVGQDIGGEIIPMYTCTDFSVPISEKKTIWYQAAQHCDETIGSNLADSMIRFLASDQASEIRKKYVFHIVPVVAVWNWLEGRGRHFFANPARDWQNFALPEIASISKTIRSLIENGEKIELALDVHTGVHTDPPSTEFCAAGIWIDDDISGELKQQGTRLANMLIDNANFPPTCIYYVHKDKNRQPGKFNGYANLLGIERVHTVELGRVCGYDSKTQKAIKYTNSFFTEWGKKFIKCICDYLDND